MVNLGIELRVVEMEVGLGRVRVLYLVDVVVDFVPDFVFLVVEQSVEEVDDLRSMEGLVDGDVG